MLFFLLFAAGKPPYEAIDLAWEKLDEQSGYLNLSF